MVTVSVNAFDDAELLRGCLASVRELLPHARIQVIDGRYEAFPAPSDNSTDATPQVCNAYGAEYWPDGPHADEAAKHWQRIERAPDGERVLFIDADERLLTFDVDGFDEDGIYRVRIHNAGCYNDDVTYYPRYFYPEQMEDIPRVDRFWFGDHAEHRTDAITIVHRADLRGEAYQAAKAERLRNQGRDWYDDYLEALGDDGLAGQPRERCPECGRQSVTRSRVCGYGDDYTRVEVCLAGDGCHAAISEYGLDGYRYLPDDIDRGLQEDSERLQVEAMAAGNSIAKLVAPEAFERYVPNLRWWLREEADAFDAAAQTA